MARTRAVLPGLKIGFTTDQRKEYLPMALSEKCRMTLGRFRLHGADSLERQLLRTRSDLMLCYKYDRIKQFLKHGSGPRPY